MGRHALSPGIRRGVRRVLAAMRRDMRERPRTAEERRNQRERAVKAVLGGTTAGLIAEAGAAAALVVPPPRPAVTEPRVRKDWDFDRHQYCRVCQFYTAHRDGVCTQHTMKRCARCQRVTAHNAFNACLDNNHWSCN